ncbi:MAG: 2TM domain-containing protein [Flavobacteriaceae bacterium]|jgi:L-cystine uptake protein TcyP (sodium:dicarboxylate symporter family)|nr:2TM domain-containing protein [Flavobacteriaceae bacterium]
MTNYSIDNQEENTAQKNMYRQEAYLRAQKKVKKIIGFYWHLASYVIVNIFLIVLIGRENNNFWSFGTFSTAIFWGIGLFFHFIGTFGADFMFGKNWEQRKIKEYMDKDKNHFK